MGPPVKLARAGFHMKLPEAAAVLGHELETVVWQASTGSGTNCARDAYNNSRAGRDHGVEPGAVSGRAPGSTKTAPRATGRDRTASHEPRATGRDRTASHEPRATGRD